MRKVLTVNTNFSVGFIQTSLTLPSDAPIGAKKPLGVVMKQPGVKTASAVDTPGLLSCIYNGSPLTGSKVMIMYAITPHVDASGIFVRGSVLATPNGVYCH